MKNTVLIFALLLGATACKSQSKINTMEANNQIKSVIETFVKAGAQNDIALYEGILHPDFRVIANRYPTPAACTIIPADNYKDLIAKKVIGGTAYQTVINAIDIAAHTATARVTLESDNGGQMITFLLVQNSAGAWLLMANMVVQTN